MDYLRYEHRFWRHLASVPFIYGGGIAIVILDIFFEIYHRICFPLYGLPMVKRSQYIRIDRQKLQYLNLLQQVNCMYCGYVNGVLSYTGEIAARTEQYWCGIMHHQGGDFHAPHHHKKFLPYNDPVAFMKKYPKK